MLVLSGQRRPGFIFYVPHLIAFKRSVFYGVTTGLLCTLLCLGYVKFLYSDNIFAALPAPHQTLPPQATIPVVDHIPPAASAPQPSPPAQTAAATSTAPPTVTSECTPDHSYVPARALSLAALGPGLHEIIEAPHYYRVYGNSGAEIAQQIVGCAPTTSGSGEKFSGETDYWLGWQYSYGLVGNQCVITQVTVALHITQVYPVWQPTPTTPGSVSASWQSFIKGLQTHEQGHVALGHASADRILSGLQGMSAPTCADLAQNADRLAGREANALVAANSQYDTATGHGATQGAVLR